MPVIVILPNPTDYLNNPSHSFLHRVVAIDSDAIEQALVVYRTYLKINVGLQVTGDISANNLAGSNSGDETAGTIKTKLGNYYLTAETDPVFAAWLATNPLAAFLTSETDPIFTSWINGNPLAGYMPTATYDPAGGAKQVAFTDDPGLTGKATTDLSNIANTAMLADLEFNGNEPNPNYNFGISAQGTLDADGGDLTIHGGQGNGTGRNGHIKLGSTLDFNGQEVLNAPFATLGGTETLTNKRITTRVISAASYTTDTGTSLSVAECDKFFITGQDGDLKFNNPGGTPTDGQELLIRIKDNGTPANLTFDSQYRASSDLALPTVTTATKTLYMKFEYNTTEDKWDLLAVLNNF